jgi:hypothetical protein
MNFGGAPHSLADTLGRRGTGQDMGVAARPPKLALRDCHDRAVHDVRCKSGGEPRVHALPGGLSRAPCHPRPPLGARDHRP